MVNMDYVFNLFSQRLMGLWPKSLIPTALTFGCFFPILKLTPYIYEAEIPAFFIDSFIRTAFGKQSVCPGTLQIKYRGKCSTGFPYLYSKCIYRNCICNFLSIIRN